MGDNELDGCACLCPLNICGRLFFVPWSTVRKGKLVKRIGLVPHPMALLLRRNPERFSHKLSLF